MASFIEKSNENHDEQTSNKKPNEKPDSNQNSHISISNIKKEYVQDPISEEPENKKTASENKKNTENSLNKINSINVETNNLNKMDSKGQVLMKMDSRDKKITNEGNFHLVVGPEIFVSLKKGSIAQYYDIGKTLGEGLINIDIS